MQRIKANKSLKGSIKPPGDKSISHRALMLACLAEGTSKITGLSMGEDVMHTARAIEHFGVDVKIDSGDGLDAGVGHFAVAEITGGILEAPKEEIYLGNSGTSMRLLAGLVAGHSFEARLTGDASLVSRPMERVAEPLRQMGAEVVLSKSGTAPIQIAGGGLNGIDFALPVPSAQIKSAVLLAGLFADGATTIVENIPTRRHTEEMLKIFGADITDTGTDTGTDTVTGVCLKPSRLKAASIDVPSDPSAAAFWIVGAIICRDSQVRVEDVYLGTARGGFVDVLQRMGADIKVEKVKNGFNITAATSDLAATDIETAEMPGLIDEVPILAAAAAHAKGTTRFLDISELRYKESDRAATICEFINALGGKASAQGDILEIQGTNGFHIKSGTNVDSRGDHRIAMASAISALSCLTDNAEIEIAGFDSVDTSYPNFLADLEMLAC